MGKVVVMPKLGLTMTEGTVDEWKKNEGDAVKAGQVLVELDATHPVAPVPLVEAVRCGVEGDRDLVAGDDPLLDQDLADQAGLAPHTHDPSRDPAASRTWIRVRTASVLKADC